MTSFTQVFALLKKRKTERNDPKWQLAANAAIDKLPLTGQPGSFARPDTCKQYRVMARHRYRPNIKPFPVTQPVCDAARAQKLKAALTRNEEAKKFPVYVYRVESV